LTGSRVLIDQEAYDQWERYSRAVTYEMLPNEAGHVSQLFYASYGRLGTMLIKVAVLLAASDAESLPVKVEARHVYRAQMIVETWRENLHDILGKVSESNAHDDSQQLARAVITYLAERSREWTSRRNLLRKLGKTWSQVESVIDDLEQSGEIERLAYKPSRGTDSEKYRLCVPEDEPEAELSNRQ
jgi:hypothetical protein